MAAARTHGEACEAVLRIVAEWLDSPLGVLWTLDDADGLLRWQQDWAGGEEVAELRRVNSRLTFAPGVGLLGRVVSTLAAESVDDLTADPGFPRAGVAEQAGMRSWQARC